MGMSLAFMGELVPGREHLEHVLALYDPQQHTFILPCTGSDPDCPV